MKDLRGSLNIKRQFETVGPGLPLVIKTRLEIADWLKKYILRLGKSLNVFSPKPGSVNRRR